MNRLFSTSKLDFVKAFDSAAGILTSIFPNTFFFFIYNSFAIFDFEDLNIIEIN